MDISSPVTVFAGSPLQLTISATPLQVVVFADVPMLEFANLGAPTLESAYVPNAVILNDDQHFLLYFCCELWIFVTKLRRRGSAEEQRAK